MEPKTTHIADLPIADSWFRLDDLGDGVTRIAEPHAHELISANAYLVKGRERDLLVDAGLGVASLRARLTDEGLLDKPVAAVATHSHYDHVGSMHEFEERWVHSAEAETLATAGDGGTLQTADFPPEFTRMCVDLGMPLPPLLIDALPEPGYDVGGYELRPAAPSRLLEQGDVVDLGDRRFAVVHLPGHSPGSIGLHDADAGVLFAGDAVYDGPLLDEGMPGTDTVAYVATMRRLLETPLEIVHPGHGDSFGRDRLGTIAREYVAYRVARDKKGG